MSCRPGTCMDGRQMTRHRMQSVRMSLSSPTRAWFRRGTAGGPLPVPPPLFPGGRRLPCGTRVRMAAAGSPS